MCLVLYRYPSSYLFTLRFLNEDFSIVLPMTECQKAVDSYILFVLYLFIHGGLFQQQLFHYSQNEKYLLYSKVLCDIAFVE